MSARRRPNLPSGVQVRIAEGKGQKLRTNVEPSTSVAWIDLEGLKKGVLSSGIPEGPATLNWVQCHMA